MKKIIILYLIINQNDYNQQYKWLLEFYKNAPGKEQKKYLIDKIERDCDEQKNNSIQRQKPSK